MTYAGFWRVMVSPPLDKMAAVPPCSIEGCVRSAWARGWCGTHYRRWRTTGSVEVHRPSIEERFLAKVRIADSGCWEWTGHLDKDGYGTISYGPHGAQVKVRAHRWAYERWVAPIPEGLLVCHRCDNPPCVNPDHLFTGTQSDNVRDSVQKGRKNPPIGSRNGRAVLDEDTVRLIRSLHIPRKMSYRRIAKQLGLGEGAVMAVIQRRNWRDVG